MKPKKMKSLRLSKINKGSQKVVKGGCMAHICGGCGCVLGLTNAMSVDNANIEKR